MATIAPLYRSDVQPPEVVRMLVESEFLEREVRENSLKKYFLHRSQRLHVIYAGACKVMRDAANPDRLALAAHGFRELMEKVFEDLQIQTPAQHRDLKDQVRKLKERWDRVGFKSVSTSGENVLRDEHVRLFFVQCEEFFEWFDKQTPVMRVEVGNGLVALDGMKQKLPPSLHDRKVDFWMDMRSYFNKMLHHRAEGSMAEFLERVKALESFLLDGFCPVTGADCDEIDSLLGMQ